MKKSLIFALIYILPQILLPLFVESNANVYALLISTLILWLTEYVSLAYTSLMIPLMASLLGIDKFDQLLRSFAHPILFLFISCFFLSIAFSSSGLDKRISLFILKNNKFSKTNHRLLISVAILSWVLSMWISNTASCAILIPILIGLSNQESIPIKENGLKKLLITCAYGASIGGLVTPVGSPPNMLALNLLAKSQIHIDFLTWMKFALPISLAMLILLIIILHYLFPEQTLEIDNDTFTLSYKALGKISSQEKLTLISFTLTVIFWIFPNALNVLNIGKLHLAQAGILGTIPLFIYSLKNKSTLLDWQTIQSKLDWGVIFLFAGGLCLGSIMDKTGVAKDLSALIFGSQESLLTLGLTITIFAIILSELGSNTASAALLLPLIASLSQSVDQQGLIFYTLCATFGASFGFMLPVSTPPNALIFSTGRVKVKDLMKAGTLFDIIGMLTIVTALYLMMSLSLLN